MYLLRDLLNTIPFVILLAVCSCTSPTPCKCKLYSYYSENEKKCNDLAIKLGYRNYSEEQKNCIIDFKLFEDPRNGYINRDLIVFKGDATLGEPEYYWREIYIKTGEVHSYESGKYLLILDDAQVEFPSRPIHEVKEFIEGEDRINTYSYIYAGVDASYVFAYLDYSDEYINTFSTTDILNHETDEIISNSFGELLQERVILINGYQGRQIIHTMHAADMQIAVFTRFYLVNNRKYTISVMTSPENIYSEQVIYFINSFQLKTDSQENDSSSVVLNEPIGIQDLWFEFKHDLGQFKVLFPSEPDEMVMRSPSGRYTYVTYYSEHEDKVFYLTFHEYEQVVETLNLIENHEALLEGLLNENNARIIRVNEAEHLEKPAMDFLLESSDGYYLKGRIILRKNQLFVLYHMYRTLNERDYELFINSLEYIDDTEV